MSGQAGSTGRQRRLGQRVRVAIGRTRHSGTVIGVNNRTQPGVEVEFDYPVNGLDTCYATHAEVTPIPPSQQGKRR